MKPTIVYNSDHFIMVQSSDLHPNAEIVSLVEQARGGTWSLPGVWRNTWIGEDEKVTYTEQANPHQNEFGWMWFLEKVIEMEKM